MSYIAHANDDHFPDPIALLEFAELFNEKWDGITSALFAKFTKLRDILADLRGRDTDNLA